MLDTQDENFIACIKSHQGITPAELAEAFGVSERTVRTYVRKANDALAGVAQIGKRRGDGYALVVEDEDAFKAMLAPSEQETSHNEIPSTPEARVDYLLNDLLSRADWITLDDLSGILFVSRNVVSHDLKHVQKKLERFGLSLEKRPHYGIRVTGSEMSRRLCLANLAIDGITGGSEASLDVISDCVDEVLANENFQVNSAAYQNLLVHIAVAMERIRKNCYVPMEPEHLQHLRKAAEYPIAARIASAISKRFGIELPEEEIGYIAIHLAGKQSLYTPGSDEDQGLVISDEVWDVVGRMLETVWTVFHFDFRNDLELRMNLARHIVPLAVRLRYRMHIDNPLLADIKQRFPLAYSMAMDASAVLSEEYGTVPSEDEVGYIALAFALAIERQKTEQPRKNILVVCASGQGSAKLLEYRYRQEFGSWLDKIYTCDVSHVDRVDFKNIDYVFTTVPIGRELPVPVREVKYFLDDDDTRRVRQILSGEVSSASLGEYFAPELFVSGLDVEDKQAAISALCETVRANRDVPANFQALVERREELAQTSFGNAVAMPHPTRPVTDTTFVTVGVLKRPVIWNEQPVQAVFLVSMSRFRDKRLDSFYRGMAKLLTSKQAIQKLVSEPEFGTLLELLETFSTPSDKE